MTIRFLNPDCNASERDAIRAQIATKYALDSPDSKQRQIGASRLKRDISTLEAEDHGRSIRESDIARIQKREAESARRTQERSEADAVRQKADEAARVERIAKLRSSTGKIATFEDAKLYFDPVNDLSDIMFQPMLTPDSATYAGRAFVDAQESTTLLRAQIESGAGPVYVFCRLGPRAIRVGLEKLRIGGAISIVGRYVENQAYRTLVGQRRLAPIVEILYLEAE